MEFEYIILLFIILILFLILYYVSQNKKKIESEPYTEKDEKKNKQIDSNIISENDNLIYNNSVKLIEKINRSFNL